MSLQYNGNHLSDLFRFSGSVGRFGINDRADVIKAQVLLANAGYYQLPEPGMPTGWPGGELNRALIRFQKDHGLEPDGTLLPLGDGGVAQNGVGETLLTLKDKLFSRLQDHTAPSVQEADDFYRIRPMLAGESEPQTNVHLRSDSRTGEYIGLKPVASDALPPEYRLKPGQQEARAGGKPDIKTAPPSQPRPPATPGGPRRPVILPPTMGRALPEVTARPDLDALRPPDPAQPEEDRQQQDFARPQRGRIVIAKDGKELHVPPLGVWADDLSPKDRRIAEALNDALAEEMALHPGGGRGNALTQEGVNAALESCLQALRVALPEAWITHIAGGNENGIVDNDPLKEEHLWEFDADGTHVRKGSNRSDWTIVIARNVATALRGNTYDAQDGIMTDREASAERRIKDKTDGDQTVMVEKQERRRSKADISRDAYNACYDAGLQIRADWTKKGEFERPQPAGPTRYDGPANAKRAKKIREMRGKE